MKAQLEVMKISVGSEKTQLLCKACKCFPRNPAQVNDLSRARVASRLDKKEFLHPWVKLEEAGRPPPPKTFGIFVGLTLKLGSLCISVNVVKSIWTFWFVFILF